MSPFELAQRFIGVRELAGSADAPLIQWWLSLCGMGDNAHDEVPWCSAFVNGVAWTLRLPRSKSAAARSWLGVGLPIMDLEDAQAGDVVILQRGIGPQPGPDVTAAQGHVGFFAGIQGTNVLLLGGNQANSVNISPFSRTRVLGVRRLT